MVKIWPHDFSTPFERAHLKLPEKHKISEIRYLEQKLWPLKDCHCCVGYLLCVCDSVPSHLVSATALLRDEGEREAVSLDTALSPLPPLVSRILSFLQRGLDKRVKLMTALPLPSKQVYIITHHRQIHTGTCTHMYTVVIIRVCPSSNWWHHYCLATGYRALILHSSSGPTLRQQRGTTSRYV